MNRRQTLIVIIIIIAVILVGLGIYRLIQSRNGGVGGDTTGTLPNAGDQVIPAGGLDSESVVTTPAQTSKRADSVLAYAAADSGALTVVQLDGKILRIAASSSVSLSGTAISNVTNASFSADGKRVLVIFGTPGSLKASVFDVVTLSWQALPGLYSSAAWAPQGYVIASTLSDTRTGRTTVYLTTLGITPQTRAIASLRAQDLALTWQKPGTLILYDRPSAYGAGTAWTLDTKTNLIVPLIRETTGMDLAWDPLRNQGLVFQSTLVNKGGSLALVSQAGVQQARFNFLTLPAKCSFTPVPVTPVVTVAATTTTSTTKAKVVVAPATVPTKNYVACGVPTNQDQLGDTVLPDAYYQKALFTNDRLVVIDLDTQGVVFVGLTPDPVDATDLKIIDGLLYFTNRYDNALYAVPFQ